MIGFKATLVHTDSPVYPYVAYLPKEVVSLLQNQQIKRVLCSINGGEAYSTAAFPDGENTYFFTINKVYRDKYKLKPGDEFDINLEKDSSKYGMPISKETEELLNHDEEFNKLFHELTPGKQRSLLYIINKFKSVDKRIEKSIVISEHLKANGGKLDFKMLNVAFKEYKHNL